MRTFHLFTRAIVLFITLGLAACKPTQTLPDYFVGTNFWYDPILASDSVGGNADRLASQELYFDHVRFIVDRFKSSNAIYSWQVANEPRCFSGDPATQYSSTTPHLIHGCTWPHRPLTGSWTTA